MKNENFFLQTVLMSGWKLAVTENWSLGTSNFFDLYSREVTKPLRTAKLTRSTLFFISNFLSRFAR